MRIVLDLQGTQSGSRFRGIGRYSLGLAKAIAREAHQHEVWIALNARVPDSIEPIRVAFTDLIPPERIRVFDVPGPVAERNLANVWRMQVAELLREKFLADLRPDVVHISTLFDGLVDEAVASVGRLDTAVPAAVTLYDLIPFLRPETHLAEPADKRSYLRRLQSLKRADLLLAISESTRQDAVKHLEIPPGRIVNIGAGLEPWFGQVDVSREAKRALMARCGLRRPFVLYTGGADPRKNMEGLIAAFGLLPKDFRSAYQLAIVCRMPEQEQVRLISLGQEKGLVNDELVCVGYVSDEDLRLLYNTCAAFVFPSLYEGFGLPVLEAMACGAPVLGSNRSSVPEIINREDALFDPEQPHQIADRVAAVLSSVELRESLQAWGLERAKTFTWEASARKALQAFEELHARRKNSCAVRLSIISQHRPLLAFVAPLPPERSGIAGYSAKLLPNLARHYEIICIVDQQEVIDPLISAEFAVRDVHWFEENAGHFKRVLYQFGNSEFHKHMFSLLERHPGVVLLHDFYLSDVLFWMEASGYAPSSFTKALYDSHGFSALANDQSQGREVSVRTYPCNSSVFQNSIGVVVHSNYAISLARKWYGDQTGALMRRVPFLPFAPEITQRTAARKRLCLPENAFVVCSFGLLTPAKLSHRLLEAWLGSPLAKNENCFLIFVGNSHESDYEKCLSARILESSTGARIQITGYIDKAQYSDYLAAADLAVQLRTRSRGETSAAIFDCLSRGVPLVVNAHGSSVELPEDAVVKLNDNFTDEALSAALARLHTDGDLRGKLAARCVLYLNEVHHSERVAQLYRDILEDLYTTSPRAHEEELLQAIGRTPALAYPTNPDLAAVAIALAANRERFGLSQILVDVTLLAKVDVRSGIQRVTRAILMALIADPPPGYRIEPVRAVDGGYVYARRFACQCLALSSDALTDDLVEAHRGDIFLGLDLSPHEVARTKAWFLEQRRHGVQIVFVTYDLLPLLRPEFFSPTREMDQALLDWINTVTAVADAVVCISRTVADEFHEWLIKAEPQRPWPLALGFFHLGADLHASLPTRGVPADAHTILDKLRSRPSFLMVGTLEPRKGYRQALGAFEQLWADGVDANLVIVGAKGWMIDDVVDRLSKHRELDSQLFWLQGISDEMLEQVYCSTRALLAASEAEGFGLPLIEAAQYGLPIIARDIPVFREVAGEHAYYFRGNNAQDLADALLAWLALGDDVPSAKKLRGLTWQQSSRQLLDVVLGERWYHWWPDAIDDPRSRTIAVDEKENRKHTNNNVPE